MGFGVTQLIAGFMPGYVAFVVVLVPMGVLFMTYVTTLNATFQLSVDPRMRGRAMSMFLLVFMGVAPIGAPVVGMLAFLVGLTGAMVYFVYKLFRIWQLKDTLYKEVYKSLTVFSTLSMLLLLITAAMTIQCMLNFDRGLKNAITRSRKDRATTIAGADNGYLVGYDGKALTHLGDGSTSVLHLQPRLSLD